MRVLLLVGVLCLLGCGSTTLAGPCTTTCDCDPNRNAPIKCPGAWACNADKWCEYSCASLCEADGGCADPGTSCVGELCVAQRLCR